MNLLKNIFCSIAAVLLLAIGANAQLKVGLSGGLGFKKDSDPSFLASGSNAAQLHVGYQFGRMAWKSTVGINQFTPNTSFFDTKVNDLFTERARVTSARFRQLMATTGFTLCFPIKKIKVVPGYEVGITSTDANEYTAVDTVRANSLGNFEPIRYVRTLPKQTKFIHNFNLSIKYQANANFALFAMGQYLLYSVDYTVAENRRGLGFSPGPGPFPVTIVRVVNQNTDNRGQLLLQLGVEYCFTKKKK
jgi:hypothetical protein